MIDNFITISFKNNNKQCNIKIIHNEKIIYHGLIFKEKSFEIEKCNEHNTLSIEGVNIEDIDNLSMFDLGHNKLKQLLQHNESVYILNYKFPVFPWLHQTLNFGWLVRSI